MLMFLSTLDAIEVQNAEKSWFHLDRWNRLDDAASTDGPSRSQCREHLDAPLTVEHLAERAGMSSRHFTRAFIRAFGQPPPSPSRSPLPCGCSRGPSATPGAVLARAP